MLVIVIPLALFYVADTVVVCIGMSTFNGCVTLITQKILVVVLVRGTRYGSLALITLKVLVCVHVLGAGNL